LEKLARRSAIRFKLREGNPDMTEYFQMGLWTMSIFPAFAFTPDRLEGPDWKKERGDALSRLEVIQAHTTPEGKAFNELASKVWDEQFVAERSPSKYPMCRPLIVDKTVDPGSKVLSYETTAGVIREAIRTGVPVALRLCGCRIREQKCNHRLDVCFAIGLAAAKYEPIPEQLALQRIEEGFKEGLIPTTWTNTDPAGAMAICMCCSCCCDLLSGYVKNVTGWGNPYQTMKTNFEPKTDREKGNLCGVCVKKCPVNARWHHWPHKPDLSDNYVFLEAERCLGCGVCAYLCPKDAITMVRVRDDVPEPNLESMLERVYRQARH